MSILQDYLVDLDNRCQLDLLPSKEDCRNPMTPLLDDDQLGVPIDYYASDALGSNIEREGECYNALPTLKYKPIAQTHVHKRMLQTGEDQEDQGKFTIQLGTGVVNTASKVLKFTKFGNALENSNFGDEGSDDFLDEYGQEFESNPHLEEQLCMSVDNDKVIEYMEQFNEEQDYQNQNSEALADSESKYIKREDGIYPSVEANSEQQQLYLGLQRSYSSSSGADVKNQDSQACPPPSVSKDNSINDISFPSSYKLGCSPHSPLVQQSDKEVERAEDQFKVRDGSTGCQLMKIQHIMEHCPDLDIPGKQLERSGDPKIIELILSGRRNECSVMDVLRNQEYEECEDNIIFTESNSSLLYPSLEKSNIIQNQNSKKSGKASIARQKLINNENIDCGQSGSQIISQSIAFNRIDIQSSPKSSYQQQTGQRPQVPNSGAGIYPRDSLPIIIGEQNEIKSTHMIARQILLNPNNEQYISRINDGDDSLNEEDLLKLSQKRQQHTSKIGKSSIKESCEEDSISECGMQIINLLKNDKAFPNTINFREFKNVLKGDRNLPEAGQFDEEYEPSENELDEGLGCSSPAYIKMLCRQALPKVNGKLQSLRQVKNKALNQNKFIVTMDYKL
ncbi:hypothetical protein FGO68_gene10030 [Halteria grandinella]|uniref:Uncharacterized protein n=1 Tax=Halteria grandinella TaxID=5974 RepID=A0A8J8T4Z3_HALGN|nr:hypothetical protein FGO68_gene10030 [Halteria grandinella]